MANVNKTVELFALSTCGWCRKTREWLDQHAVEYELHYVDKAQDDELAMLKQRMQRFSERMAFPLLVVDDGRRVIQGYHPEDMEEELA